ncbi:MAG: T9SS type A sorting domain-containing protein [Bacteroidia bacterium]
MKKLLRLFFFISSINCYAQFPGPPGTIGSTAIHKDSSIFVAWANHCQIERGWLDIANKSLGTSTVGIDSDATGKAGDNPIVSLGDSGVALLTFNSPITNGPGFDFAVFENGFNDQFLELAFVEVSSDGVNFKRFPATSNTQTITQIGPWDQVGDATRLNNLAGKYKVNYGTPFDLDELKNEPGLDVNAITHVKIIDVVGSINSFGTRDINQNIINDPYPTDFGNGGFDLDAVGVIHSLGVFVEKEPNEILFSAFPNPSSTNIKLYSNEVIESYCVKNNLGQDVQENNINAQSFQISKLEPGIYFLFVMINGNVITKKLIFL